MWFIQFGLELGLWSQRKIYNGEMEGGYDERILPLYDPTLNPFRCQI
jgi:hypothetical protein